MTSARYVHGYSAREAGRLGDQADTLAALLHQGTAYPPGSRVLEAGCGTGAQTVHLVASSPQAHIVAVDHSERSLARARERLTARAPGARVEWCRADLLDLPYGDGEFDHLFVCFVLEHLPEPQRALAGLRRLLRPGGTVTVIEGDHGSVFFHPHSARAHAVVETQVRLQSAGRGDALIGRRLHPLLTAAGYTGVDVRPLTVYADENRPDLVQGFTRDTFIAMYELIREDVLAAGLIGRTDWDSGIADLHRTAEAGGTFHYTYFKGVGVVPGAVASGAAPGAAG